MLIRKNDDANEMFSKKSLKMDEDEFVKTNFDASKSNT